MRYHQIDAEDIYCCACICGFSVTASKDGRQAGEPGRSWVAMNCPPKSKETNNCGPDDGLLRAEPSSESNKTNRTYLEELWQIAALLNYDSNGTSFPYIMNVTA